MNPRLVFVLLAGAALALVFVLWTRARSVPELPAMPALAVMRDGESAAPAVERGAALEAQGAPRTTAGAGEAPAQPAATRAGAGTPSASREPSPLPPGGRPRAGLAPATIGEAAVVPATVQSASPEEEQELAAKYAGSTPEELRAQRTTLQELLDAHRAAVERGDARGRLEVEQLRKIQIELGWLKTHGGS